MSHSATQTPHTSGRTPRRATPPLSSGDRLTHEEFLERYAAMPDNVKAERIEGIVYMPAAAVSADFHGIPHANMMIWLGNYRVQTPNIALADNSTIFLDLDNDPQPDACLYILSSQGGQAKTTSKGYISGSPELIAEIAGSSVSIDLNAKLNVYRRNGVREYIVHRTYDGEIDWFILRDGQYERLALSPDGIYRSPFFPGLWLNPTSFTTGDMAEVLAVLQRGIATNEHAEFVRSLSDPARQPRSTT